MTQLDSQFDRGREVCPINENQSSSAEGVRAEALEALSRLDVDSSYRVMSSPLPDERDHTIRRVVDYVFKLDKRERERIGTSLSVSRFRVLDTFAFRMATVTLRTRDISHLQAGLRAMAVAGDSLDYDRESAVSTLAALADAADRLGASISRCFATAADYAGKASVEQLRAVARMGRLAQLRWSLYRTTWLGWLRVVDLPDGPAYEVRGEKVTMDHAEQVVRDVNEQVRKARGR